MTDLKLYHFRVSQEWSVEGSGYVWAHDEKDARKVPEWEIRLYPDDDVFSQKEIVMKETTLSTFLKVKSKENLFFAPDKTHRDYRQVDLDEFMKLFNYEELERQRTDELEKNNGQLPLFE
jgi:hypothetical protein